MSSANEPSERYAEVARRELLGGNLREPIWQKALADHNANFTLAEHAYIKARLVLMESDEQERAHAEEELRKLRLENDRAAQRPFRKTFWLLVGILLGIGVFLLLSK